MRAPYRLVVGMLGAAAAALALAVRAPLAVTVLGLLLFGVLHNVLEIRYVAGRFAALLTGRFLALLLALTTGIALCRFTAAAWPSGSRYAEVAIGYAILAAGCSIGLRGLARLVGLAVLAVGAFASFRYPAYHFVVLTHLHNLVPLVFLWDWAGFLPRFAPDATRCSTLGCPGCAVAGLGRSGRSADCSWLC